MFVACTCVGFMPPPMGLMPPGMPPFMPPLPMPFQPPTSTSASSAAVSNVFFLSICRLYGTLIVVNLC